MATQKRVLAIAACILVSMVGAVHAGLIGRGRWQGDEYFNFVFFRDLGNFFFTARLLQWSPRPWSELLFYLYGDLAARFQRPFIGGVLGLTWGALALACVIPACLGPRRGWRRLLIGLSLFALFLVGQDISEMFFWPAAALAYVTTLAGVSLLFWRLADGSDGRKLAAFALVAIAGCTEIGAFFVAAFAVILGGWQMGVRRRFRGIFWVAPGAAVAVAVLWLIVHGQRFDTVPGAESARFTHHQVWRSLAASLPMLAHDLVPDVSTLMVRLLVLIGIRGCWTPSGPNAVGIMLPAFAAALLIAAFASAAGAWYQLGEACCQRHDTLRHCLLLIALAALAVWSTQRWPIWKHNVADQVGILALTLAVLIPFAGRVPALIEAYREGPIAAKALKATWQSGLSADSDVMTLMLEPTGTLIHPVVFVPGRYVLENDTLWSAFGVLKFFGKKTLIVLPPNG